MDATLNRPPAAGARSIGFRFAGFVASTIATSALMVLFA